MEQRGIRTDLGDMNRQIEVSNRELRQLRARIAKVKGWLFNAPLSTTPSLVDMMQNSAGGKRLETQWKRIANIKTQAKLLIFLTSNGIYDIEQLAAKVEQMHTGQYEVANRIKDLDRRKDKLTEHLANVDAYNQNLAVHRKYKKITDPKKRDAFFMKHEKEIEQYKTTYQYLKDHLNGRTAIPEKEWRVELASLIAERYALCEEYYKLKDDVKSVEVLQRGAEHIMNENVLERTPKRSQDISL
jgi:septal ring factor EnvC (AmiA/AmiB activator)